MATQDGKFHLRLMEPADSAAVVGLITDFDGSMTTNSLVDAYTAITAGAKEETLGVVVERDGFNGLVGMGTVRFSQALFNGDVLPLAFLDGLKVHPNFRGQGLGHQIARWRIERARARYGERCVIGTGLLQENTASRTVARKWCRDLLEPAFDVFILPTSRKAPEPSEGMRVREVEPGQFEQFSERMNASFREYNLHTPMNPAVMADTLAVKAEGQRPYRFYAAVDERGNLLAGARTWARGLIKADKINHLPASLRLMNSVLRVLPADGILRDVAVTGLWFAPGQMQAAKLLWETIRWACSDQGNSVAVGFDPRDPAREVLTLKPWHQPRPKITMAFHGPDAIDQGRLILPFARV